MPDIRTIVTVVLVVLASAGATCAESTPEAVEWIEKLVAVYDGAPFQFRYDADLSVSQMGQMTDVKIYGRSTQGGNGRARIETTMEMPLPGTEPATTVSIDMLGVSDGNVFWVEADNPGTGQRQVIKLPLEKLNEIADKVPMARNLSRMDPLKQIHELTALFDFEVASRDHQTVTLRADLTGEALDRAKEAFEGVETSRLKQLVLILRADTGFPDQIRIGGPTQSAMSMRFFDLEFLDELADEAFAYTPPEGAEVTDLGALIDAGLGARGEQP
jgi:hypothetical protein